MTARKCGGEEVAYSPREIASGPTDYISKFKASSHSDGIKDREKKIKIKVKHKIHSAGIKKKKNSQPVCQ